MKPIYFLSLIPVIAILGGPFWANSIEPYILGMPLFFFLELFVADLYRFSRFYYLYARSQE